MSDMTRTDSDSLLHELADREAIRDLVNQYAHQVWRKDIPAIIELFAEDGEMDTETMGLISGRKALTEDYGQMLSEDVFQPFVHNHIIELDGDTAEGTCYLDLRATINGKDLFGAGFYDDRYVRVDGEWKFRYRKVNMRSFVPIPGRIDGQPE